MPARIGRETNRRVAARRWTPRSRYRPATTPAPRKTPRASNGRGPDATRRGSVPDYALTPRRCPFRGRSNLVTARGDLPHANAVPCHVAAVGIERADCRGIGKATRRKGCAGGAHAVRAIVGGTGGQRDLRELVAIRSDAVERFATPNRLARIIGIQRIDEYVILGGGWARRRCSRARA